MLFIFREGSLRGPIMFKYFPKQFHYHYSIFLITFCTSLILTIELISFPYKPIKLKHDNPIIIIIIIIIVIIIIIINSSNIFVNYVHIF